MIKANLTDEQEVKDIAHLATQICGLEKGSLSSKSRKIEYQLPRSIVSNIARVHRGIHYNVISKVLDRDRTSIYHYESKHKDNYLGWKDYRELFNRIFNAYSDISHTKKTFDGPGDMVEYLQKMGMKHSRNPQMQIHVITDIFTVSVPTTYKQFSDNLEICNLALKDYACRIDIEMLK